MPSRLLTDLNSDVGEGVGDDEAVIPVVTSANIACGGHAGDTATMARTVSLALAAGVGIGAHPGYPDREGFGRREMQMSDSDLEASLLGQLEALAAVVAAAGTELVHVKPHGALYNRAAHDEGLAEVICRAVERFDPRLIVVALAGSPMVEVARGFGLIVAAEAFADRAYEADGSLRSRRLDGALKPTPEAAAEQAVSIVTAGRVTSYDGTPVAVAADTLCIHGDTPGAADYARVVRGALQAAGVKVVRLAQ